MTFRKADGTFAYDEIYALNEASENGSVMAMSKSKNFHNWYGLLFYLLLLSSVITSISMVV